MTGGIRVRERTVTVRRARQALRSHRRVQLHRRHLVQARASPAHAAMSGRVQAEVQTIALAEERRASVDR